LGAGGLAVGVVLGPAGGGDGSEALQIALLSIFFAGILALLGLVVGPWLFLLARTLTRERAARARAEERADMAGHLHDSVLQTLTLIQRQAGEPAEVMRLARGGERELRSWLYVGVPGREDDFVGALTQVVAATEDRFGMAVELVTVGTCELDERSRALVGAASEALTNAAKHAGVTRVSVFAEVCDGEAMVTVRDRGCGFDPTVAAGPTRRGLTDSVIGRMRQHGGTATIRSAIGAGTVVELRMALGASR
jgi:signal transduction histidine kinase